MGAFQKASVGIYQQYFDNLGHSSLRHHFCHFDQKPGVMLSALSACCRLTSIQPWFSLFISR